jgi:predicted N-acetyltransferase YhbS|nr:N-acetyltransferase [uncultured Oscillibacter sp.]
MQIRRETPDDYEEVYALIMEAFASAEHADGTEQDLTAALRKSAAFIPELSLVAEANGRLAGHILFTKITIGGREALALAPLSVRPEYQRQGVGTALMDEGHRIAKELGYSYSVVLGSERYYPRFGYVPAERFGIVVPEGVPSINFMARKLREDAGPMNGPVCYAKEFGM